MNQVYFSQNNMINCCDIKTDKFFYNEKDLNSFNLMNENKIDLNEVTFIYD